MLIQASSLEDLPKVAEQVIDFAGDEKMWLFLGEMGAGKTTLIKEICHQLGVIDNVQSPTFSIVNEYLNEQSESIYHFDFYRLEKLEEALNIGIEEYFYSGSICLMEWPQKIEGLLPETFMKVEIESDEQEMREFKLTRYVG